IRIFTVNRWVTEDNWLDARAAIRCLDRFILDGSKPSRWVNRWLAALIRLFRPEIEHLLQRRDATLAAWRAEHRGADAFAARDLEVLSEIEISIAAQTDALARAMARTPGRAR